MFSSNGDYIGIVGTNEAIVICTGDQSILSYADAINDYSYQGFIVSKSGNYIVFSDLNNNVYKMDMSENEIECIGDFAISNGNLNHTAALSEDGSFLAFNPDNSQLFIQKSDYFYYVYDLKKDDYVYLSTETEETFNYISWNEDDTITLVNDAGLFLLDAEYERILYASNGSTYIASAGKIYSYCNMTDTVLAFSYYSLDDLTEKEESADYNNLKLMKIWEKWL